MEIKVILWVIILVSLGIAIFRIIKSKEEYEAAKLPTEVAPPQDIFDPPSTQVLKHLPQKLVPTLAEVETIAPQAAPSFPPELFKKPEDAPPA